MKRTLTALEKLLKFIMWDLSCLITKNALITMGHNVRIPAAKFGELERSVKVGWSTQPVKSFSGFFSVLWTSQVHYNLLIHSQKHTSIVS